MVASLLATQILQSGFGQTYVDVFTGTCIGGGGIGGGGNGDP